MEEVMNDVQQAIDFAFRDKKYVLNSYSYLKVKDLKRADAQLVLRSSLINEIYSMINDLNLYIKGGQTSDVVYVRDAYGYLSKPEARKIAVYLDNIIEGIKKYIIERKGVRGKKIKSK
jgi:hypothetical protein